MCAASCLPVMAGIPAAMVHNTAWAIGLICLALWGYAAWATMGLTFPSDLFDQRVVATVTGLSGFGAGMAGTAVTLRSAISSIVLVCAGVRVRHAASAGSDGGGVVADRQARYELRGADALGRGADLLGLRPNIAHVLSGQLHVGIDEVQAGGLATDDGQGVT